MNQAEEKYVEINRKLVAVLDELLAIGSWDASLFLKTAGKKFEMLKQEAQQLLCGMTESVTSLIDSSVKEKAGHIKVYISVYQAEGNNFQKWHSMLKTLSEYSISRPIYKEEEHAKAIIRSKTDIQREGYVCVFIKTDDILSLPNNRISTDRLGNELLTLKAGAVKPGNIVEFIHCGQCYRFLDSGLVLIR